MLDAGQDAGGVHINSSITNHAFYLLAKGMNGAIGLDEALNIFYRAVTTKLNPGSQFVDCRLACVASANELFGNGSNQSQKTAGAFDLVEIFDHPTPFSQSMPSNSPRMAATFITMRSTGSLFQGEAPSTATVCM